MSRRRQNVEHLQTVLDILCNRGHRVGGALKFVAPHPRAGQYATAGGIRFQDHPDPADDDTGRLRGRCGDCGADVQAAWPRVRERLDENAARGRHTDELTP